MQIPFKTYYLEKPSSAGTTILKDVKIEEDELTSLYLCLKKTIKLAKHRQGLKDAVKCLMVLFIQSREQQHTLLFLSP